MLSSRPLRRIVCVLLAAADLRADRASVPIEAFREMRRLDRNHERRDIDRPRDRDRGRGAMADRLGPGRQMPGPTPRDSRRDDARPMDLDNGAPADTAAPAAPLIPAAGPASVVVAEPAKPLPPAINREKVCPLLLRVFPRIGGHHELMEFQRRGQEPKGEVAVYTWPDATLRELTELVKEVNPAARRLNARLEFAFVYPDRRGRNVMRVVGSTISGRPGIEDDAKTLKDLKFETGDFLDCAIYA